MSLAKRPTSHSAAVRTLLPAAAGFLLVSLIPARAERLPLPPAEQEKVNDAIVQGVRFLKKTQLADGSWTPVGTPHRVGYTALPGLTLLECGEPLDAPVVKKAIHCVRRCGRELDATCELALSSLLLDRVGDAKDRDLIVTMALRPVAGQTMTGGWGYRCPTISPQRQKELLVVLRKLNPRPAPGFLARDKPPAQERNTMDCVGLIGLAVGHGISQPAADNGGAAVRKNVQDPRILNGFLALSRHVGQPAGRTFNLEQANLYYLWSLERVAVIYGLPTIGGKDWYRWGAEMLVANQQPLGNWTAGQYHGASPVLDTCMALLFLKKANLARDLAARLPIDPDELVKAMDRELSTIPAKLPPAPPAAEPPAPPTPPESPKVAEPLVEIPPPQAAPPPVSPPAGDGNRKLWGYLLLGVFLILALLSGALVWQYGAQRKRQSGGEKVRPAKGSKAIRRE